MMKRLFFALLTVCLLTVHVWAYDAPNMTPEGSDTVLETFITSAMSEDEKQIIRDWLDDDLSFIVYVPSTERYLLLRANVANKLIVNRSSSGLAIIYLNGGAIGTAWDLDGDALSFAARSNINSSPALSECVIVGGRYFDTCDVTFPSPINTYVADFEGRLLLRDDGGLMSDPETEPGEDGGILGFLKGFWDKLKDFFVGLFVPEDGYFQQWYQSLKAAVDEKLSSISALYNGLTGFFNGLSGRDVSVIIEIPANHFYSGSPAVSADIFATLGAVLSFLRGVLTGFVVLLTAIICYKKLVTIFSE
ncbi:MAG: hypothetical protein PHX61_15030 [Alphaproteobacteria bacterium]|nr:hypothetical protein [Alphaproteobacteria bacterium]